MPDANFFGSYADNPHESISPITPPASRFPRQPQAGSSFRRHRDASAQGVRLRSQSARPHPLLTTCQSVADPRTSAWAYLSSVVETRLWSSRRDTTTIAAPACNIRPRLTWRRSCSRNGVDPAGRARQLPLTPLSDQQSLAVPDCGGENHWASTVLATGTEHHRGTQLGLDVGWRRVVSLAAPRAGKLGGGADVGDVAVAPVPVGPARTTVEGPEYPVDDGCLPGMVLVPTLRDPQRDANDENGGGDDQLQWPESNIHVGVDEKSLEPLDREVGHDGEIGLTCPQCPGCPGVSWRCQASVAG